MARASAPKARLSARALAAIERARLSVDIKDLATLPKPVKLEAGTWRERLARRLVESVRALPPSGGPIRRDWLLRALRMTAVGTRGWVAPAKGRGLSAPLGTPSPFTGYVTSSDGEEAVVRLALLLRRMRREGEALDLLRRRVLSGLDDRQSRHWLAHLLGQAGEKKAAAELAASAPGATSAAEVRTAHRGTPPSLRYGIVILTMFDTPVFRSSLRSLVESDFQGRIVVVEDGYEPEPVCRDFCATLPVNYIKRTRWTGSAEAMNEGIQALADETDVVTFAHNDILWPPTWFESFDRAWSTSLPTGKVGLINLGYLQFKHKLDTALSEMFVRGEYAHLQWILTATRDVAGMKDDRVQDSQVHGGEPLFGLSRDPWNDWVPDLRFMTGRFSIAASFPVRLWREMGGFDTNMPYGFDLQLQHHCLASRQWMLFLNNPPLIHLASSDTRSVDPARRAAVAEVHQTLPVFEAKYGWQVEHFLNVYFSETAFIYQDDIVRAANRGRFDDIDFVFDDFQQRLRERTIENCELTWCRSRATCRYQPAVTQGQTQV